MPDSGHDSVIACQVERRLESAVMHMVSKSQSPVRGDQVAEQVFMVAADQDHLVFLHQFEDILLKLLRFLPAVEQVAAYDDLLMRWLHYPDCVQEIHIR